MTNRKTNLSSITKNLFNNDYDQDTLFSSPLKSSEKSKSKVSSNQSPIKLDIKTLQELIDHQNQILKKCYTYFYIQFLLFSIQILILTYIYILQKLHVSKLDNVDNLHETQQQQYKTFRFRRNENFQSQPILKIEVKNDVDEFFNNNTPINIQLKQNKESKQYQLITFSDYVEKIYGKDWFTVPQRRYRRQTSIQEFFDIIE